jgi:hypothetical protein
VATVRCPDGLRVVLCAWIQIKEAFSAEIVYTDEAVIGTLAYEGYRVGVRGPYQLGDVASHMEQRLCFGCVRPQIYRPYLAVREECDLIARRRRDRIVTLAQLSRFASCSRDEPDILRNAIRGERRIWVGSSWKLRVASSHVDKVLGVGSPRNLIHLLAVILIV